MAVIASVDLVFTWPEARHPESSEKSRMPTVALDTLDSEHMEPGVPMALGYHPSCLVTHTSGGLLPPKRRGDAVAGRFSGVLLTLRDSELCILDPGLVEN